MLTLGSDGELVTDQLQAVLLNWAGKPLKVCVTFMMELSMCVELLSPGNSACRPRHKVGGSGSGQALSCAGRF